MDQFTYTITDSTGHHQDTATVTVQVFCTAIDPIINSPTSNPTIRSTAFDGDDSSPSLGLSVNEFDPDADGESNTQGSKGNKQPAGTTNTDTSPTGIPTDSPTLSLTQTNNPTDNSWEDIVKPVANNDFATSSQGTTTNLFPLSNDIVPSGEKHLHSTTQHLICILQFVLITNLNFSVFSRGKWSIQISTEWQHHKGW